ncbi:unnamed protein product [Mytilus coruscus]|uniref:B box-type domain-containing protein n=1 Tax=Mytilus coruscus TaxID=42192 RepID=A0A6J8DL96_MYTCO|nr:unnamed protein product [Mytilus coruscus]
MNTMKRLPKYDFANAKLNITPGSHRVGDKIRHFIDQTEENDIKNVSNNKVCSHRNYEQERINSVIIWLKKAKKDMDIHTFSISAYEADKLQELRNKVNILNEKLNTLNMFLEQRLKGAELVQFYKDLVSQCKDLVNYMQTLKLPDTKSVVLELTDAGPGVGKSNRDVRMRATEKVRLDNLDLYARIHRATGDCQNEVERTQAAVGRAIVDRGSIKWKHKSIEDYDNAKQLSFDEYEKLEEDITIHNVLETCKDLSSRVDGSPGPRGDFMEGLVSEDKSDLFYTDAKYLKDFLDASETKKHSLSGYHYYFKLQSFYEKHFEEGELYIEFRKNSCIEGIDNGTLCDFCQNGWRSTIISRIPRPFPGQNYQYLSVKDTPLYDDDGSFRKPDDFQPRAQIRKLHKSGLLCSQDKEKVDEKDDQPKLHRTSPKSSSEDEDDTEDTQESDSPGDTDIESFGDASSSENESEHSTILRMDSSEKLCDLCNETTSSFECSDCELVYCEECCNTFHSKGALKSHRFQKLRINQSGNITCENCTELDSSLFCEDCSLYYCSQCSSNIHQRGALARHILKNVDTSNTTVNLTGGNVWENTALGWFSHPKDKTKSDDLNLFHENGRTLKKQYFDEPHSFNRNLISRSDDIQKKLNEMKEKAVKLKNKSVLFGQDSRKPGRSVQGYETKKQRHSRRKALKRKIERRIQNGHLLIKNICPNLNYCKNKYIIKGMTSLLQINSHLSDIDMTTIDVHQVEGLKTAARQVQDAYWQEYDIFYEVNSNAVEESVDTDQNMSETSDSD